MSFVCHCCPILTFHSNNRISLMFAETIFSHFSQHFTFDKNGQFYTLLHFAYHCVDAVFCSQAIFSRFKVNLSRSLMICPSVLCLHSITSSDYVFKVITPHVTIMRRMRGKRPTAISALEWLLSAVLANVRAQNRRSSEGLHTVRTLVGPVAAVYSHVFVEAGRLSEAFSTFFTLMWAMFLMHVKNVHA